MFSNELFIRRHDQNNLPKSFFPTDITLNKMPRAWNSLKSTYKAISSPKYFKTSLFSSFISDCKEESNCTKDLQSHYSVDRMYFLLSTRKTTKENHITHLSSKFKGLNKTPYFHGALNSLHVTLIRSFFCILFYCKYLAV